MASHIDLELVNLCGDHHRPPRVLRKEATRAMFFSIDALIGFVRKMIEFELKKSMILKATWSSRKVKKALKT